MFDWVLNVPLGVSALFKVVKELRKKFFWNYFCKIIFQEDYLRKF